MIAEHPRGNSISARNQSRPSRIRGNQVAVLVLQKLVRKSFDAPRISAGRIAEMRNNDASADPLRGDEIFK